MPGEFRHRLLRVGKLDAPIRRIVGTTYAVLLALALSVALRAQLGGPLVEAEPGVKFPLSVAVLSGFCTGAGVALIFAAGAAARGAWRYVAIVPLATVTAAAAAYPFGNAVPESLRPLWWVPLVFLAAAAAVLIAGQRIQIRWTLFLSLAICLLFVSVMAGISMALAPTFAPTLLFLFLGFSAIALGPALVVLGFDFSEIVTVFSGAALSWVGPRKYVAPAVRWLLPTICVTGTAAYLAEVARLQDALKIAVLAFALAFVFAAIVLSLRSKEGAPHHEGPLSYHSVLLISVMLLGGTLSGRRNFFGAGQPLFQFYQGAPLLLRAGGGMDAGHSLREHSGGRGEPLLGCQAVVCTLATQWRRVYHRRHPAGAAESGRAFSRAAQSDHSGPSARCAHCPRHRCG